MNESSSTSSLKTQISEFCQAFTHTLKPFASSLEAVRADVQGQSDADATLQRLAAEFSDGSHRLESLINKVEQQQAYLIIFGPLKSGKSTLMNAISAAYVSEVTSLPAYPCLVHVKHGDDTSFVAWRYNGECLRFPDNLSLQAMIKASHETLAERLRAAEEAGETFDPGVHYPEAIRRVDVSLPAPNLKDSLTVLVDTPGLYTRMKFGYNLMTREFRNSAACAVFVVKTDNLFLEQVFAEFTELLDLFSRIFIVVNIDSNKRDLEPDGSLQPSLESKSPGEVINAFQSLVMSAPLRRAQQEGRLKIYPVDLLSSAAAALKQVPASAPATPAAAETDHAATEAAPEAAPEASAETTPEDPISAAPAPSAVLPPLPVQLIAETSESSLPPVDSGSDDSAESPAAEVEVMAPADTCRTSVMPAAWSAHPETSFSLFLKDLTDYLNSSEYLQEFMGDALLMGANIGTQIRDHSSPASVAALKASEQRLVTELTAAKARLAGMQQLEALDLDWAFAQLRSEFEKHLEEVSAAAAAEARTLTARELEQWYTNDNSVAELQRAWEKLLDNCAKQAGSQCHLKARTLVSSPLGGISLDESMREAALGVTELLAPVALVARNTIAEKAPALAAGTFKIKPEHLAVRKSWWDWLTFASVASIRRKFFGPPDAMERAVPVMIKEKRLGADARQALEECILSEISRQLPDALKQAFEALVTGYIKMYRTELSATLVSNTNQTTARIAALQKRIETNRAACLTLAKLAHEANEMLTQIDGLGRQYQSYSRVTAATQEPAADADEPAADADEPAADADEPAADADEPAADTDEPAEPDATAQSLAKIDEQV